MSDSGENIWSYASTSTGLPTFQVDMARHADSFGVGAIDTVAAEAQFVPPSSCQIFGWDSTKGDGTPVWSINVTNCDSNLLYDDDRFIDISDDGSTVAFSGYVAQGASTIGTLWVIDGQSGAVRYSKTLDPKVAPGGPVQTSENGTWVAWSTGNGVMVADGKTGAVRDTIGNSGTQAEISDSGDFVAFASGDVYIYSWDATNNQYKLAFQPVPSGGPWYATSCAISSDGSGAADKELVTVGFISADALQARVLIYSMVTGAVVQDYLSPTNAQLQTYPTVRSSGDYSCVCLWGDQDDVPTAIVMSATAAKPVFTYVTPGSMFGVDCVHDISASTPANDVVYFTVAGKHTPGTCGDTQGAAPPQERFPHPPPPAPPPHPPTPTPARRFAANVMGNGGDAYAWVLNIPV